LIKRNCFGSGVKISAYLNKGDDRLKYISGLIGFIFISFGSLLMNITENGETFTNVTLKISGFFALIIGLKFIFPNMGFIKSKK